MSQDDAIYDLGEVKLDGKPTTFSPVFEGGVRPISSGRHRDSRRGRGASRSSRVNASRVGPGLAGSLSLFFPGLGEMAAGEVAWGLFYTTGVGLCAAMVWASIASLDRLLATLNLLGIPMQILAVVLIGLTFCAMLLHLAGVFHAYAFGEYAGEPSVPHPIVAGIASLLVPGWGQLLAGHRRRAGLFLSGLWALGIAWLVVTPEATRLLSAIGLGLPAGFREGWGPVAMLAVPVVMWVIAVYDAAAGAAAERRERDI